jgi:hypothetical protein
MGDLSDHFSEWEFRCRHCGVLNGRVVAALIVGLEVLRDAEFPDGLPIISGYRCPLHNRNTPGAATGSQHLFRAAADIPARATLGAVRRLRVFSGIGWQWMGSGKDRRPLVRHVDVRHASGNNTTGGTLIRPTVWEYKVAGGGVG